jgi:hypothetical protein
MFNGNCFLGVLFTKIIQNGLELLVGRNAPQALGIRELEATKNFYCLKNDCTIFKMQIARAIKI